MNNNWLRQIKLKAERHNQWLIHLVFIGLIFIFIGSLNGYWKNTLKPRLYAAAETQANILAESQAANLIERLSHTQSEHLHQVITDTVKRMLIVEDPAIGERFIRRIELQLDYTAFNLTSGSLDLSEGEEKCLSCFIVDVPLINRQGDLLGLATFFLSNAYFQQLSNEMKSKLVAESSLTLLVLIGVWMFVTVTFYRLNRAKKIIEASDLAKTRFMANITHELRTPLNAILGHAQVYKKDNNLMATHGEGIEAIYRNADHLLLMINDILEFSAANEEQIRLQSNKTNLRDFTMALVDMAKINAQLKSLAFNYYYDPELPSFVEFDDKRLRQVLLNLLSNAVKFTHTGSVSFSVFLVKKAPLSSKIRFSIEDTGIGIDHADLSEIFIPFQQLDNPITRAEGTGLGLTISQRLVRLMNSTLQVSSKKGAGSQFWFDLDLPSFAASCETQCYKAQNDSLQPTNEMVLPSRSSINELLKLVQSHNILAIRNSLQQLKDKPEFAPFLQHVSPFVQNYRFKPLAKWLQEQVDKASSD